MIEPTTEFKKHAQLCENMARETLNPSDRASWRHLGERWQRCAENAMRAAQAAEARAHNRENRHHKDKWAERQAQRA